MSRSRSFAQCITLPSGSLTGDEKTLSDKDGEELSKQFEIHEMNLLADPPSGTKVKERDWSKYTTASAKSGMSQAEETFYDRLYEVCEMYINDLSHIVTSSNFSYISSVISHSDLDITKEQRNEVFWWFKYNNPQFYFVKSYAGTSTNTYVLIYDFCMDMPDQAATTNEMFDKLDGWIA